jgi:hypothetical protein
MENEAECTRRMDRLTRRDVKKRIFSDRVHPNILLTGWKTWWSRMEAESKREEHSRWMEDDWARSRGYQNNMRKETFVRKFFTTPGSRRGGTSTDSLVDRVEANVILKCGQSPKRKLKTEHIITGSPAKKQKLSKTFSRNLNFWKNKENGPHEVPTDLIERTKTKNISHTHITISEVVRQRDSPGGIDGSFTKEDRSGELCQP